MKSEIWKPWTLGLFVAAVTAVVAVATTIGLGAGQGGRVASEVPVPPPVRDAVKAAAAGRR